MNHTDYRGSCPHTGLIGSKVSQTAEKSRYRRIFSKALSLFLLLTAALLSRPVHRIPIKMANRFPPRYTALKMRKTTAPKTKAPIKYRPWTTLKPQLPLTEQSQR